MKRYNYRRMIKAAMSRGHVQGPCPFESGKLLELEAVPVDFQEYETEVAEWADLIADNRLAELAKVDDDLLKDLLKELPEDDLNLTGFDEDEITRQS